MADLSLKEIALKAGVSVGTVDRVIHNRGNVSSNSKQKVLEIIKQYDYKPNLMARGLANKNNFKIAALIPSGKNDPFWLLPLNGIAKAEEYIRSFGFSIEFFHFDDSKEKDLLRVGNSMFEQDIHAVLLAPIIKDEAIQIFQECDKRKIPYVQINTMIEYDSEFCLSYVGQDSFSSGMVAAKLFDIGLKKEEVILILHLEREVYNSEHLIQKERGFRNYFKSKKDKKIVINQLSFAELDSSKKRRTFIKYALEQNPNLSGIFVTTSKLHRVIEDFISLSKNQLTFIGFDLIDNNLVFLEKNIVSFLLNQNPEEQGYRGIMTLFDHMLKKSPIIKKQYLPIDVVMKENMDFYKYVGVVNQLVT